MNKAEYEKIVQKAKECLKKAQEYQTEVAKAAVEVCEIRHGGISNGIYTLGKFADDIGMNRKTLANWVAVYRDVVMKVSKETTQGMSPSEIWKTARNTQRVLHGQRRSANEINGTKGKKTSIKRDASGGSIDQLFERVSKSSFEATFKNIIASQRHLKHCLRTKSLFEVLDNQWIELMGLLDENSDFINNYLTRKKKKSQQLSERVIN